MHKKEGTVLRMLTIAHCESCWFCVHEICYFSAWEKLPCRVRPKYLEKRNFSSAILSTENLTL